MRGMSRYLDFLKGLEILRDSVKSTSQKLQANGFDVIIQGKLNLRLLLVLRCDSEGCFVNRGSVKLGCQALYSCGLNNSGPQRIILSMHHTRDNGPDSASKHDYILTEISDVVSQRLEKRNKMVSVDFSAVNAVSNTP